MKRKVIVMLALIAMMALASGAVALADTGEGEGATVEGEGTIIAHGVGVAVIRGDGVVDIRGHGGGTVWISGAEVLDVSGQGYRHEFERGVLLVGWEGQIHVEGERIIVRMVGGVIDFKATGRGMVFLKGEGWYKLGDREDRWRPHGQRLRLGPPLPPPPAE
ncbi:MAG: hypothetical protein GXP39_15610 [Chloroflexi bacterium]|nr:hypothetical protein [Chloroflexota bacterium]